MALGSEFSSFSSCPQALQFVSLFPCSLPSPKRTAAHYICSANIYTFMLICFFTINTYLTYILFKHDTLHSYDDNALPNQHLRTIYLLAILNNYKTPLIIRSKHYNE